MYRLSYLGLLLVLAWSRALASPQAAPTPPTATFYAQEPFLIEKYYSTARFENDGTGERDLNVRIRVQSDAGLQALGELVFGYSDANEKMDVRSVVVHKADGTNVTAGPDAVNEMTAPIARDAPVYTDYREKHITGTSLRPGDTLEYSIATHIVKAFAPNQFWFEHNFLEGTIVLDEQLELNVPKGRAVNLQSPDFRFEKAESGDRAIYRWKRSVLSRPADDAKKKTEDSNPKPPSVRATTFETWEEIAHWYSQLEEGRTEPSPEIRAKTQELIQGPPAELDKIQGRTAELDKIQALYDYVSKNIRYVSLSFGLSRYQPHPASEVFANQYGDCKDKHTLLAAMLEAAGIRSDAVLIPSLRKLDTSLPSPSQFDHVITAVPLNGQLVWMDTTTEVAPFRLLAASLRNKS